MGRKSALRGRLPLGSIAVGVAGSDRSSRAKHVVRSVHIFRGDIFLA